LNFRQSVADLLLEMGAYTEFYLVMK